MPAPAFPVVRAGQKVIHDLFECIWRGIILKGGDLLGRGWQPYEIEISPADEGEPIRARGGRHSFLLKCRADELIDSIDRLIFFDGWRLWIPHWLPGPMLALFLFCGGEFLVRDHRPGRFALGPGSPEFHPMHEIRHRGWLELLLGRHLKIRITPAHRFDQPALLWFSQHHRHAGLAALHQLIAIIQVQTALELFRLMGMTFVTGIGENGPNLLLEKLSIVGLRSRPGQGRGCAQPDKEKQTLRNHTQKDVWGGLLLQKNYVGQKRAVI